MADFFKKLPFGGYAPVRGGYSDYECTHVIITKNEYTDMINKLHHMEKEKNSLSEKYSNDVARRAADIKRSAEDEIFRVKQSYKMKYGDIENQLLRARKDADYQRSLNRNLLRITKERANADRQISRKKEHTGYRVINSEEFNYMHSESRGHNSVVLWKTVIQTPYSVDFSENEAREQTKELFTKDEDGDWLIHRLGINGYYGHGYENMLQDSNWNDHEKYNVVVSKKLKANYRDGYWEVIIIHTKPLGIVPKEMRYK